MKTSLIILYLFTLTARLSSQDIVSAQDSFRFYGDAMFSMKLPVHKIFAENHFLNLAKRLIQSNADSSLFSFHPSFVVTESKDQIIKIISWQIELESNDYHYCAYIFVKNAKPVFLRSVNRNLEKINYESFNSENWFGALYYHFLPDTLNGCYTLFGYRFSNEGFKYRIIDAIKINNGTIQIGCPIFKYTDDKNNEDLMFRKVIGYSASANLGLTYDEESKIIYYDHIDVFTDPKSGEILRVPDGTFEAFELKNNYWNYIPYHKLKILESAPEEKPVLDKRTKDLFGKEKRH